MRRLFTAVLLSMMLAVGGMSVHAQASIKLRIGAKIPQKFVHKKKGMLLTSSAQFWPYIEVSVAGIRYTIAYEPKTRKIKYISTMDSRFRTKAGLKVHDEITVLYKDLDIRPYFGLRGPVGKDGWQPVIGGMSSVEDAFLERVREKGKLTTTIDRFVKSED